MMLLLLLSIVRYYDFRVFSGLSPKIIDMLIVEDKSKLF